MAPELRGYPEEELHTFRLVEACGFDILPQCLTTPSEFLMSGMGLPERCQLRELF